MGRSPAKGPAHLEEIGWHTVITRLYETVNGVTVPAWPDRYPVAKIVEMYEQSDRNDFLRNMMMVIGEDDYEPSLVWTEAAGDCYQYLMTIDLNSLSASKDYPSSFAVIIILGQCAEGWQIVNMAAGRWTDVADFHHYFNALLVKYQPKLCVIENTGIAPTIKHALRKRQIECILTDVHGTKNKMTRIREVLLPALDKRKLVLSTDNKPSLRTIRDVFKQWPNYKARGDIGPDVLDALTNAIPYLDHKVFAPPKPKPRTPNPYYALSR